MAIANLTWTSVRSECSTSKFDPSLKVMAESGGDDEEEEAGMSDECLKYVACKARVE